MINKQLDLKRLSAFAAMVLLTACSAQSPSTSTPQSTSETIHSATAKAKTAQMAETRAPVINQAGASKIKRQSEAGADMADWGSFHPYFTDDTHILKPVLVGVAKIKAGQQIHPPHRHADEEYMMITKGRGVWSLNGVEQPAAEGDILFARAWDYHGVRAAPDSPLEFVVFKYSGRQNPPPTDPNPELPEEEE